MDQPIIQIKNLKKAFGERVVLKDINFDVHKGEVVTIIGSSGSGKSTLLRCINLQTAAKFYTTAKTFWEAAKSISTVPKSAWCSSSSICSTT